MAATMFPALQINTCAVNLTLVFRGNCVVVNNLLPLFHKDSACLTSKFRVFTVNLDVKQALSCTFPSCWCSLVGRHCFCWGLLHAGTTAKYSRMAIRQPNLHIRPWRKCTNLYFGDIQPWRKCTNLLASGRHHCQRRWAMLCCTQELNYI